MNDKLINEMLEEFDKSKEELEEALKVKNYGEVTSIQGYLLGIMQCLAIIYKHNDKKAPKEIEDRFNGI